MKVRNPNEVQSLDDELNLFDEQEWDFMSVVETRANNYEYFNDIRDADFDVRKPTIREYLPHIAVAISLLTAIIVVAFRVTSVYNDPEWLELQGMQSVQGGTNNTSYVDGTPVSAEDMVDVAGTINSYLSFFWNKSDYSGLDIYCVGKSTFAQKYYETTDGVSTIYDTNDCYARGLREFASYYKVQRINQVLQKGDTYYVYATVQYSTIYDVSEFVNMHMQTFMLKFQGGGNVSEAPVAKFLLEVIAENYVPLSNNDVCIQMKKVNGEFVFVDDSFLLQIASDDYQVAVNQLVKSLGGMLTN